MSQNENSYANLHLSNSKKKNVNKSYNIKPSYGGFNDNNLNIHQQQNIRSMPNQQMRLLDLFRLYAGIELGIYKNLISPYK